MSKKMYLGILKDLDWPNPSISSASADPTTVTGASGVKMTGPYEYVPPMYWLADTQAGGAFTVTTPRDGVRGRRFPPKESLERFIRKDHLWPIDEIWNFHCGGADLHDCELFTIAVGEALRRASYRRLRERKLAMTETGQRAIFEAGWQICQRVWVVIRQSTWRC